MNVSWRLCGAFMAWTTTHGDAMNTTPPTETPAPLSPEGLVRALRTCRGITQHEQDCISNAAKALAAANARIAEVETNNKLLAAENRRLSTAAETNDERAESLERRLTRSIECTCPDTYRAIIPEEHHESCPVADYALAKRQHEIHVAAMQEIGRDVERMTPVVEAADAYRELTLALAKSEWVSRARQKLFDAVAALATRAQDTKEKEG